MTKHFLCIFLKLECKNCHILLIDKFVDQARVVWQGHELTLYGNLKARNIKCKSSLWIEFHHHDQNVVVSELISSWMHCVQYPERDSQEGDSEGGGFFQSHLHKWQMV